VIARYQAGESMNDIARNLAVHKRTIGSCLARQDIPTRRVGLATEHLATAAQLYRSGWSLAQIGDRYRTTDMSVRRALAASGVQIRPRRGFASL